MKGSDKPFTVVDRKSAIKGMIGFFSRHGVDGIECPAGFKGFEVEAVNLYKRFGKSGIPGKTGKVNATMKLGSDRIPVIGYILDGTFAALVSPAAFVQDPKRESRLEVHKKVWNVLGAFRAHFVEWNRDPDMALMFRVMESSLDILNSKPVIKRSGKGG